MGRYLDKFMSIVPERQSRQVLEVLGKLKDKGAIKSIEEYSDKLQELTTTLKSTDPIPAFNLFQAAVGDEISSDIHNAMTETAAMDIETAFQEAQNIGNVLEMHKNMFRVTVLENLHKAIATLSTKLKLYQFLADSHDGFAYTQFNTFDNFDSTQTARDTALANSLYFDYNKNEPVPENEDAEMNKQAQSLELANIGGPISIVDIHAVEGDDTTVSVIDLASVSQGQPNTIDGKKDTFWVYPIILAERISTGATLKMRLDLGGIRRVNSIYIDAATKYPMTLTSVTYLPQVALGSASMVTVFSGATAVFLPMRVSFASINAQFIELTFKQKSWEEVRYWVDRDQIADTDAFVDNSPPETETDSVGPTSGQLPGTEDVPTEDEIPQVVAENISLLVESAAKEANKVAGIAAMASYKLLTVSNALAQAATAADSAAFTKPPAIAIALGEIAVSLAEDAVATIAVYVGIGGAYHMTAKKAAGQARADIDEARELLELATADPTGGAAADAASGGAGVAGRLF